MRFSHRTKSQMKFQNHLAVLELSSGGVSEPDFDGPIFTSAVLKYSPIHKVLAAFYALPMQKSAPAKFCDLKVQNFKRFLVQRRRQG